MVIVENTCKCIHGKKVDFSDNYELQYNLIIKKTCLKYFKQEVKTYKHFVWNPFKAGNKINTFIMNVFFHDLKENDTIIWWYRYWLFSQEDKGAFVNFWQGLT